jgi:hypothetical protein
MHDRRDAKGYALHCELDIPPEDPSPAAAYRSIRDCIDQTITEWHILCSTEYQNWDA